MAVVQKNNTSINAQSSKYVPVRMLEVEIGQSLPTLFAVDEKKERSYERARCLVRLHSQPLGIVELQFTHAQLSPNEYAPAYLVRNLHAQINHHLIQDGLPQIKTLTAKGYSIPLLLFVQRNVKSF